MKPTWANQRVYDAFDSFLQTSILQGDSLITTNPGIFTLDNLEASIKAFVDNPDEGNRNFNEKSRDQFSQNTLVEKEVFAHFIWLWALPADDMREWGKRNAVTGFLGDEYRDKLNDVFFDGGIGSAGQFHKINKPFEISYLLLLFREMKKRLESNPTSDIGLLKKQLEKLCKGLYYDNQGTTETNDTKLKEHSRNQLALHHIILHLCDPERYEAIAAYKHKRAIIDTFYSLLDKENTADLWDDIDESILLIRQKLIDILKRDDVNFYDDDIQEAWNFGESKNDISEVTLFEYKKAMIFYGPPGTSKTHSAERLAELLISKQYFRNRNNIKEYFQNSKEIFKTHIHHLQLHSNYNYEDFIAGLHIQDKSSVVRPGYLLNLIKRIKDDKLPHVLILDEINRVDISRLFGELFSALEYRNKPIKLAVGDLEISLPDNLYFIGTMNQIDFSLEQVDFALQRRFLWSFKGFDENTLRHIIRHKQNGLGIRINDSDIETFIRRCERLNNDVSSMPELGENYQIGHTFFAEIIDIFKTFRGIHLGRRNYVLEQPINILWEVSIKPILQAFLGNMDYESKKEKLDSLRKGFVHG